MTSNSSSLSSSIRLKAIGFCGVDDSIHPNLLAIIANAYPMVEFGVLFRPDKEGHPRYPTMAWVEQLSRVAAATAICNTAGTTTTTTTKMKLAAHLCGTRVNEILLGDDTFVKLCYAWGFRRIQINATAVNGVDMSQLQESAPALVKVIQQHSELEFILQCNQETLSLCQGVFDTLKDDDTPPKQKDGEMSNRNLNDGWMLSVSNVSLLMDESKGTGLYSGFSSSTSSSLPSRNSLPNNVTIGYAGGIGPHNIKQVLQEIASLLTTTTTATSRSPINSSEHQNTQHDEATVHEIWIDMESSLRSRRKQIPCQDDNTVTAHSQDYEDIFDLTKCYQVIHSICEMGLCSHPQYLSSE